MPIILVVKSYITLIAGLLVVRYTGAGAESWCEVNRARLTVEQKSITITIRGISFRFSGDCL